MNIAGIIPISTVDWPGRSCMTIFMRGCNLRCVYCHNSEYLDGYTPVTIEELKEKIDEARPFISAVVFSGGEPLQQDFGTLIIYIHSLNLKVGVHTNGCYPRRIFELRTRGKTLGSDAVDKFFIDIKAPLDDPQLYFYITNSKIDLTKIIASLIIAGHNLEIRTTVFKDLIRAKEIEKISQWVFANTDDCEYVIQRGRSDKFVEYSENEMFELKNVAEKYLRNVRIR
jgi:pyruvate formate lyase activating enzyme